METKDLRDSALKFLLGAAGALQNKQDPSYDDLVDMLGDAEKGLHYLQELCDRQGAKEFNEEEEKGE